jgi:hypothetical protein
MKNTDTLLENARALVTSAKLDENVDHIKSLVSTVKVGDSTTFGKVLEIGANSITFKAKDLPKTTIAFNARKMGSKDYVLDKLLKLKEALDPNDDAGVWIDDFVKSDDSKFSGKSKEERIKMALGAWYAAQKKESLGEETLEEATLQKQTLKQILRVMETQSFYSWYKKDFTDYIEGDADGKTEEEIIDDLHDFFN